eukprot:COSAG05_NODE_4444_length_1512_cov_1.250531_1_plen_371_part_00
MHDSYLNTFLMRALPIIWKRTRRYTRPRYVTCSALSRRSFPRSKASRRMRSFSASFAACCCCHVLASNVPGLAIVVAAEEDDDGETSAVAPLGSAVLPALGSAAATAAFRRCAKLSFGGCCCSGQASLLGLDTVGALSDEGAVALKLSVITVVTTGVAVVVVVSLVALLLLLLLLLLSPAPLQVAERTPGIVLPCRLARPNAAPGPQEEDDQSTPLTARPSACARANAAPGPLALLGGGCCCCCCCRCCCRCCGGGGAGAGSCCKKPRRRATNQTVQANARFQSAYCRAATRLSGREQLGISHLRFLWHAVDTQYRVERSFRPCGVFLPSSIDLELGRLQDRAHPSSVFLVQLLLRCRVHSTGIACVHRI